MSKFIFAFLILFHSFASADTPVFDDIDRAELEEIIDEFGSSLSHTSVSPASSLGSIFGFELGVIGGLVQTEGIERIVRSVSPGTEAEQVPHAALYGALTIPFGITVESTLVPEIETSDYEFQRLGLGLKWTITDTFLSFLPLSIALKAHMTRAELSFAQVLNNSSTANQDVNVDIKYDTTITGLNLIVSKNLLLVTPYAGIGFVKIDGELGVESSTSGLSIFDPGLTSSSEFEEEVTGEEYFAGVQFNLLLFKFGIEAGKILDNEKISAKFSLKF